MPSLASVVSNPGGKTIVGNAGSNGKYLAVLDLDIGKGKVNGYQYRLLPIFANLLEADSDMAQYVEDVRAPHLTLLNEGLATTDSLLYRRGNFIGSFDQVICDALRATNDAQIALSPGWWEPSSTDTIRYENADQTCMTYPSIRAGYDGGRPQIDPEDVADNLFNPDRIGNKVMIWFELLDFVTFSLGRRLATESQTQLRDGTPTRPQSLPGNRMGDRGAKSPGPPAGASCNYPQLKFDRHTRARF